MSTAQDIVHNGSCLCGAISFKLEGKPLFSIYCHCTQCQRADGAAFVSSMHFPNSAFTWTHSPTSKPDIEDLGGMTLYRCPKCRSCAACQFGAPGSDANWTIRGSHLARDPESGRILDWDTVKPTGHIFYGTRLVDVADDLPKWEGFSNRSERLG
ncbi:GFA domain-containing protein [Mycena chlorophos]|uniref:GFA domain-containing protein n=1 Tax=Mycena chlorophos TaxID=658473 RepID=A0A8H6SN39_MYCCL|nr:GFA domain-containing protein [Mycena chlorophos]